MEQNGGRLDECEKAMERNGGRLDECEKAVEQNGGRLDECEKAVEQDDGPDHLPELVLRLEGPCVYVAQILCNAIQGLQIYLATLLMRANANVQVSDIEGWDRKRFIEWQNGTNAYGKADDVNFLAAFREGTIALSEEGFSMGRKSIFLGVTLLIIFEIKELHDIFCKNKYHLKDGALGPATVVLVGQLVVCFWLVFACTHSVITSSLDTATTIEASTAAFFILEIDENLLGLLWTRFRRFRRQGAT